MQEFSSISVSTYNPDELTGQLNEQANNGWNVVAIVPTGSTVTAYLSRESTVDTTGDAAAPAVADEPAPADEPAHFEVTGVAAAGTAAAAQAAPEPAAEAAPEPAAEPALPSTTAAEPAVEPAPEPAAEPAAAAAPAGWYADPSSRFELRYWDGSTWTEHVSRGGQQFTDPPVA